MPKATSAGDAPPRVVIVTLDSHLAGAARKARQALRRQVPGLDLRLFAATGWRRDPQELERCRAAVAEADIVIATMLFVDEHIQAILPDLRARRNRCRAMVACMSAPEVMRLTRMGRFRMDGPRSWLSRLAARNRRSSPGERQLAILKRIPRILRFIPGKSQDVRAWFLTLQYWTSGSQKNLLNMVRFLLDRYMPAEGHSPVSRLAFKPPAEYPDVGLYHPAIRGRISADLDALPNEQGQERGTVGLLLLRSYILAGDTGHYDGAIRALESRGLKVVPVFASGLDARPAVERFFLGDGGIRIDVLVSLTGFSLVGGPAYNDSTAAVALLSRLDVPYVAAHPVEFQTLDEWERSSRGHLPVEATLMVALPELDGGTGPMVIGGRAATRNEAGTGDMRVHEERAAMLAARVAGLAALRRMPAAQRRIAIVIFDYPPNGGNTGTAAYLSVFESVYRTLRALKAEGYSVNVPRNADELRSRLLEGNSARFGTDTNVHARIPLNEHVRRERWLEEIEAQWGPAPGRQLSDGAALFVPGERFGNVLVGIQPAFGYEGDPMRLLFDRGFTPTHAFSAFYRYIREDFDAGAVLHFGTHGALEFMPGKQCGLAETCWPDRLIGSLPNFYLYASNNPSEGTIAKRRSAATLISYLTPPVANAGLLRGFQDIKSTIGRWRALPEDGPEDERTALAGLIRSQAEAMDLLPAQAGRDGGDGAAVARIRAALDELERTLIPYGLHVLGASPSVQERTELLRAMARASHGRRLDRAAVETLADGGSVNDALRRCASPEDGNELRPMLDELAASAARLAENGELSAVLRALDGRYIAPAPGADLLQNPGVLPTGRNMHGFDPLRIPSPFAVEQGARQAERLLERHRDDGNGLPESVALVLWGTDNLKTEGAPVAQALALIGARPRFDSYGRLAGAALLPLAELGRPRIDVVATLSGIFRDLLPAQTQMLAEAAFLAATADEPEERNFVRRNARAYREAHGCDMETAALRVFSNADGAYGSNVNNLVSSSRWQNGDELADVYMARKSFAYSRTGAVSSQKGLLTSALADVELAHQNLDSVELGVTTVDHYFDTLGGISRAVEQAGGRSAPVYISDGTQGAHEVRTLGEQVNLETRTRALNPKWYEAMLQHGFEGVRQIEVHVTNTMGWSATARAVDPWVYQRLSDTFVLDGRMRERLANLNPKATARMAGRLLEAHERNYWSPDEPTLEALRQAADDLEDRLEGILEDKAA